MAPDHDRVMFDGIKASVQAYLGFAGVNRKQSNSRKGLSVDLNRMVDRTSHARPYNFDIHDRRRFWYSPQGRFFGFLSEALAGSRAALTWRRYGLLEADV